MEQTHNIYDLGYEKHSLFFFDRTTKKAHYVSVNLRYHIITPINDRPLASVLHSADDTLYCFQINNLIRAKFFVGVEAIPQRRFDFLNQS